MALDMDNLAGLAGEVIGEVADFEDNWGWPGLKVTGRVLRADHPEWKQYTFDVAAQRPEAVRTREAVNQRVFHGLAPKGFRRKAQTEGEAHQRMLRQVAENEKLLTDVMQLRDLKHGIASILCKELRINGESEILRNGITYDLNTVEGREAFLDHALWQFDRDGERVQVAVPVHQQNSTGPLLDDAGEPVRNTLAGWNLGDAIAALLRDSAEETERFVRGRKADALEPSGASSTGLSASGSPSPSNDGG